MTHERREVVNHLSNFQLPSSYGATPETFSNNLKYDAPEEVGGDRKSFVSPMSK